MEERIVSKSAALPILDQSPCSAVQESPGASGAAISLQEAPCKEFRGRAAIVTLGCAKNQVDSEVMAGVLMSEGYEIVPDVQRADVAIVNTCGFLEKASEESLDRIFELSELKEAGQLRTLVVAGCMVERYKESIQETLPEVDLFLGTDELLDVGKCESPIKRSLRASARPYFLYDDSMPRFLEQRSHSAYVKIAEGCNRPCAFCIIPQIRGRFRSRAIDSVVREVQQLADAGVREVNLVAQDLTAYGSDKKGSDLAELLSYLNDETTIDWIRLLYAYPLGTDARLIEHIRDLPRVCDYLDIPFQHVSERVLGAMRRPRGKFSPRRLVDFAMQIHPELSLRTTFIVGFPGETEKDVQELEQFVAEGRFASVGVFTYSKEVGTDAGQLSDDVSDEEKQERRERIMLAQSKVNQERLQRFVGKRIRVIIDGLHDETDALIQGRAPFQAPEVDGVVLVNDVKGGVAMPARGAMGLLEVTEVAGYDLVGRWEGEPAGAAGANSSELAASALSTVSSARPSVSCAPTI